MTLTQTAFSVVGYFGSDFAFALDGSDYGGFVSTTAALVVLALVARPTAYVGFVGLNDTLFYLLR